MIWTLTWPACSSAERIARDPPVHHVGRRDDVRPRCGLHQSLLGEQLHRVVVDDIAGLVGEAVMAVGGIGIERDVGQHADLRRGLLGGLDRAADEIVRVERLARLAAAQGGRRVREKGDARNAELPRLPRPRGDPVDRPARHAGQGRDRFLDPLPLDTGTAARSGRRGSAPSPRTRRGSRRARGCGAGARRGRRRRSWLKASNAPHPACKAAIGRRLPPGFLEIVPD